MKRNLFLKFVVVLFIMAWAIYEMTPPTSRDLVEEFQTRAINRDGVFSNIVQQVTTLQKENPQRSYGNLVTAIGTNDITRYFPFFNVKGEENPNRAVLNRIQKEASGQIKLGLDLRGGTSFLVGLDTNNL